MLRLTEHTAVVIGRMDEEQCKLTELKVEMDRTHSRNWQDAQRKLAERIMEISRTHSGNWQHAQWIC